MISQLKQLMGDVISGEITASIMLTEAMSCAQMMGYNGFKRLFRYMSRDRLEHALILKNTLVDYLEEDPTISITYVGRTNGNSQSIDNLINSSMQYAQEHINKLKVAANLSFQADEHYLGEKIEWLIKDEEKELKCLRRIRKEYDNAKKFSDTSYLSRKDMAMHEKMKHKEESKQNKKY